MKKRGASMKRIFSAVHDDLSILFGSLLVLMAYELIAITAFFLSISVDVLTAVQFVALGFVAVLFKVRARVKRQNLAWFFWAFITFFGGLMFTLNTVVIQGDDVKPEYVRRAESAYQSANDALDDLLAQQAALREANRRTAAREMEPSISAARETVDLRTKEADATELRWKTEPEKKIRAIDIFARIPYVLRNPSYALLIAAGFFVVLFISVEASVFAIAGEIGKPIEAKPKKRKDLPIIEDRFDDVTEEEYRKAAEYADGTVRLPEDVARNLRITRDEAERKHAEIYPGYVFRTDRYVKIGA